jgi:hypothetical protein
MARRYYSRRSYYGTRNIGHERARQHIEDYYRLTAELGGSVDDVRQYFFSLKPLELRAILDAYELKDGSDARAYAEKTFDKWRTGQVHMSGTVAERLFSLLPPRMPLATKYELIENLWNHVGPKSKKTLRVGLDANIEQVLGAIASHIDDVVVHFRIPESLERRFNWLAVGDAHVKQDLLNHLRSFEKALVVEGARARLPVMIEHLRSEAGRHTHRIADVLKIGNHELELLIDKASSGVSVVEPFVPLQSPVSRATSAATGSYKWLWWVAAAAVALFIFVRPQSPGSSYQPSTHTTYQPNTHTTYQPATRPTNQPTTRPTESGWTKLDDYVPPQQPAARPATPPLTTGATSAAQSDSLAGHGPGRVHCDVEWSNLHRSPDGYQDFIRDCMRRNPQ